MLCLDLICTFAMYDEDFVKFYGNTTLSESSDGTKRLVTLF